MASIHSFRMALVVAGVVLLVSKPDITAAALPGFSWDTVPLFWHAGNSSGPFNDTLVAFVATEHPSWSLATIEKYELEGTARTLDRVI